MTRDIFRERERGEEDAYFRQKDAELIEKLRRKAQLSEIAHALAEKLHADEPELLKSIQKLGVTLDTGSAFILAPLVEVAWVDGSVSEAERDTILHIAQQRGVAPGSSDYNQLVDWLARRPSDEVFKTALEAIRIGLSVLRPKEAEQRIATMTKACEDVARAADWVSQLLELDDISYGESEVIAAIRRNLESKKSGMVTKGPASKVEEQVSLPKR